MDVTERLLTYYIPKLGWIFDQKQEKVGQKVNRFKKYSILNWSEYPQNMTPNKNDANSIGKLRLYEFCSLYTVTTHSKNNNRSNLVYLHKLRKTMHFQGRTSFRMKQVSFLSIPFVGNTPKLRATLIEFCLFFSSAPEISKAVLSNIPNHVLFLYVPLRALMICYFQDPIFPGFPFSA